jgi:hypothetical protein
VKGQFAILRQRTFRHLFLAQAVSWLGTAIAPVALAFAILGRPGGTVVDEPQVQSANALIQLAQNSTRLLGASISGVLVVAVGPGWGWRSTP